MQIPKVKKIHTKTILSCRKLCLQENGTRISTLGRDLRVQELISMVTYLLNRTVAIFWLITSSLLMTEMDYYTRVQVKRIPPHPLQTDIKSGPYRILMWQKGRLIINVMLCCHGNKAKK